MRELNMIMHARSWYLLRSRRTKVQRPGFSVMHTMVKQTEAFARQQHAFFAAVQSVEIIGAHIPEPDPPPPALH